MASIVHKALAGPTTAVACCATCFARKPTCTQIWSTVFYVCRFIRWRTRVPTERSPICWNNQRGRVHVSGHEFATRLLICRRGRNPEFGLNSKSRRSGGLSLLFGQTCRIDLWIRGVADRGPLGGVPSFLMTRPRTASPISTANPRASRLNASEVSSNAKKSVVTICVSFTPATG